MPFFEHDNEQFIVIRNSTKYEKIELQLLDKVGYTTKNSQGHGYGLANVSAILRDYPFISLNTSSSHYIFQQELIITGGYQDEHCYLEDESIHIYRLTEIISSLLKDLGVSSYDLKTFKDKKALLAELFIPSNQNIYFLDLELQGDQQQGLKVGQQIRDYDSQAALIFLLHTPS